MPAPFKLNFEERAIVSESYYQEKKRPDGSFLEIRSVDRAVQRIDKGNTPKSAPKTAALVNAIHATDGLVLTNDNIPAEALEEGEQDTTVEEIAENAIDARRAAEAIIAEGQSQASAADRAQRQGKAPGKRDSKTVYASYVVQVRIERVNAGEHLTYYDAFEAGREVEKTAKRYNEFYALWVTRLYVKEAG